jgi:hypothetical protein
MPVHYFKHGRRHGPNGEDPIPAAGGPTTVIGYGSGSGAMSGGALLIPFEECYTNDTINMGYTEDNGTNFDFLKVTQPGIYQIHGWLGWNTDFTAGDVPYLELLTWYPSTPAYSTLPASVAIYDNVWGLNTGVWNQQNTTAELDFHSMFDVAHVVFDPSDAANAWTGEAYTGFGARIRASFDRTKTFTIQMSVTRLGPVGSFIYDGGPV